MAQHRKPKKPGSKLWMALGLLQYYFYLYPRNPPILFLSLAFSLCLCLQILTLSSSGAVGGSGQGMGQWRGRVSFLLLPGVFFSTPGGIISIQTGGDSTHLFIVLYKHFNGKNRGRGRNRDYVHVIKTAPRDKQSRLYSNSYFRKNLDCIYLPLKCKCHFLLWRSITISRDLKPRNQHPTEKLQTYETTHSFLFSNQFLPCKTRISYLLLRHRNQQQIETYLLHSSNICSCVIFTSRVP